MHLGGFDGQGKRTPRIVTALQDTKDFNEVGRFAIFGVLHTQTRRCPLLQLEPDVRDVLELPEDEVLLAAVDTQRAVSRCLLLHFAATLLTPDLTVAQYQMRT